MKNHFRKVAIGIFICCLVFAACSKNNRRINDTRSSENNSNVSSTDDNTGSGKIIDQNALNVMPVMQAISKDNINEILETTDNFSPSSEGIYFFLPEECDCVYTFANYYNFTEDGSKYKDSFLEAVKEVFPEHDVDEKNLMFVGKRFFKEFQNDSNATIPAYSDYKDLVDSGEEKVLYYVYQDIDSENAVFFESTGYLGSNILRFNRAKGLRVVNKYTGETMPSFLEVYSPNAYSNYVESYTPDSTESFKLINGETRICDAVSFFEDYMNNLSFLNNDDVKTKVVRVDLFKFSYDPEEHEEPIVDEKYEVYFYLMNYTIEYKGVLFSYAEISGSSTFSHGYGSSINSFGAMVNNDEVEFIYEVQHLVYPKNMVKYENILSMKDVIEICSQKVTPNVEFSVLDIGLFYAQGGMLGGLEGENQYHKVFPVWRMTLYNNNDERFYRCYVNALNGEFLSLQGL